MVGDFPKNKKTELPFNPAIPLLGIYPKKMWHIYTMEYYAAIKNKFMSFVEMWMNLKTIFLSKLTEEQKNKHHMFSFIGRS